MPVLPIIEPLPAVRQTQIQPEFVQMRISGTEMSLASCSPLTERLKQGFLKIERRFIAHSCAN